MRVIRELSIEDFKRDVFSFLTSDLMANIACLRIITAIERGRYPEFHLFKILDGDVLVAVAMQTPPHNIVLSRGPKDAFQALADDLRAQNWSFPGINGMTGSTSAFAQSWAIHAAFLHPALQLQYYVMNDLIQPRVTSGQARLATLDDLDWLCDSMVDFTKEANLPVHEQKRDPEKISRKIRDQEYYIWEDSAQSVSIVGHNNIITGLQNIGPVYTPLEFRRRGFGQACTAAVCQTILANGSRPLLCADMANPTSNKLYQELGFKETVQYQEYRFA